MDLSFVDPRTGLVSQTPAPTVSFDPTTRQYAPVGSFSPFGTPEPERPNALLAGLKSGTDGMVKDLGGFAAALGNALGSRGLENFGRGVAHDWGQYAEQAGRPDLEENPWSLKGFGYKLAQAAPSTAAVIASSLLGGRLARGALGLAGETAPAFVGATAAGAPLAAGQFMNTAMEKPGGVQPGEAQSALGMGLAAGAAGAFMPSRLQNILSKGAEGDLIKRMTTSAMVTAPMGAVQSAAQTAVDQQFGDPNKDFATRGSEIVQSFLQGGAIGGTLGATFGALSRKAPSQISNDDIKGLSDSVTPRQPDAAPAPEAAPAEPAPVAEKPGVKGIGEYSTEDLTQRHQMLLDAAAQGDEDPKNMRLRQLIEGELKSRDQEQGPTQQESLPLPEPEQKFPASEAYQAQQDAIAATQKSFVDTALEANKGKPTDFTKKVLAENPVNTPEEFALSVYDNYRPNQQMAKLARDLGLLDPSRKLWTEESLATALDAAHNENLLKQTPASTARVQQLEKTQQLLQTISEMRAKSAEVPAFEQAPRAEAPEPVQQLLGLGDVEQPGLPLATPAPLPLEGKTPQDHIREVTGNDKAQTRSKAPTAEADLARIYDTKGDLGPQQAARLADVGLAENGKRLSFDDALTRLNAVAEDAQARRDPEALGKAQADIQQVERLKAISETNAAKDEMLKQIERPTAKAAFKELESLRRQMPPDMGVQLAKIENTQISLAADANGAVGQARSIINYVNKELEAKRAGAKIDLTPAPKASAPATPETPPSPAAQARVQGIAGERPANAEILGSNLDKASVTFPQERTQLDVDLDHILGNGGTVKDALSHIAENSADPVMRRMTAELVKRGIEPNIEFTSRDGITFDNASANDPNAFVPSSYNRDTNTIRIFDRSNMEQALVHETMHAATLDQLESNSAPAREMNRLYESAKAIDPNAYGTKHNVGEFVADAFSNPRFREFLRNQSADTGSFAGNLWQNFKNIVFRMLGMPERARSMFDQVLDTTGRLLDERSPVEQVGGVIDTTRQTKALMADVPMVRETVEKAMANAPSKIKAAARKMQGWYTTGEILQRNRDIGERGGDGFLQTKHWRDVQRNQLNQFTRPIADVIAQLPEKPRTVLTRLTTYDAYGVNPAMSWAEHTELHKSPNANQLKQIVDQANQDVRTLKQVGGDAAVKAYGDMIVANKATWMAEQNTVLDFFGREFAETHGFPGFDKFAVEHYQFEDGAHGDAQKTYDFFKQRFEEKMAPIGAFLAKADAEAKSIEALGGRDNKKAATKIRQEHADLATLYGALARSVENGERVPNFHKGRYGDWMASAHFKFDDGKLNPADVSKLDDMMRKAGIERAFYGTGDNGTVFMRFENRDQAVEAHKVLLEAEKLGMFDPEKKVRYGQVGTEPVADALPKRFMDLTDRLMAGMKTPEGLNQADAQAYEGARAELKRQMVASYLNLVPDNAVQSVLRARKFTQGASEDIVRNFVHRNQVIANSVVNMAAQPKINEAIGTMAKGLRDMGADAGEGKTFTYDRIDAANDAFRRIMENELSRPMRATDSWLDTARAWTHAWFLGFSPSYVLMQMAQPIQTTLPELGKHFGFGQSMKAMAQVSPQVYRIMRTLITEPGAIDGVITREKLMKSGIPQSQVDIVMQMVNRGTIDISGPTRELGMVASGRDQDWSHKLPRLANTIPMWSETMARLTAGLAAAKLYDTTPGKAKVNGKTPASRADYIDHIIHETMGRYGSAETPTQLGPRGLVGKVTPLTSSFMSYYFQMFGKLTREIGNVFSTHEGNDRGAAMRYVLGHTAAMSVLAGTMGMPFFNLISGVGNQLANAVTGRDDYDINTSYRNFLSDMFSPAVGDVVARGLPRALGIDMSRLGEQDLFPLTKLFADRRKWEETASEAATGLLGAPFSGVERIVEGFRDFSHGQYMDGAIKMLPTFASNVARSGKLAMYGYTDSSGRSQPIEANAGDILAQALGVKTAKEGNLQEATSATKQLEAARDLRSSIIREGLLKAQKHGDTGDFNSWLAKAKEFKLEHPTAGIMDFSSAIQQRNQAEAVAKRFGMPLDLKPNDVQMRNQMRFLQPLIQ